jgi:hypothetical protein
MYRFDVRDADGRDHTEYGTELRVEAGMVQIVSHGRVDSVFSAPVAVRSKYIPAPQPTAAPPGEAKPAE